MNDFYLKEHHIFLQEDTHYLFHVARMKAFRVSAELAEAIGDLKSSDVIDRSTVHPDVTEALESMKLVTDSPPTTPTVTMPSATDVPIRTIALNVAQLCNLSCIYCYGVDGEYGEKGYMQDGTARQAIDFLMENSLDAPSVRIWFFGGEPLLNFDLIKDAVEYSKKEAKARGKTISFSMTTNGTRFNDEVNAFLNDEEFSVMVSFDGNEEMQNRNRPFKGGKDSYEKIRGKIETFLKTRDGRASGRATVTGYNADLTSIRDALLDVGFNTVDAVTVAMPDLEVERTPKKNPASSEGDGEMLVELPVLNDTSHRSDVRMIGDSESHLQDDHIAKLLDDLEILAYETLDLIKNREPVYSRRFREILTRLYTQSKKLYFCGVGRGLLSVSKSGDVYPCHRFVGQDDMQIGHINDFDHGERDTYVDNFGLSHPKCSTCWARYFCGGGCIHESIEANGVMYEPDERWCQQLQRAVELSIFIYDHLDFMDRAHLGITPNRTTDHLMSGLGAGMSKTSATASAASGAQGGSDLFSNTPRTA